LLVSTLTSIPIPASAQTDLDRDGVDDAQDKCPNLQEDFEGIIDGCPSNFVPWYDEDFDGIEDHIDQCPDSKERYNQFQDLDGCPDTLPGTGTGGLPDTDGDGIVDRRY